VGSRQPLLKQSFKAALGSPFTDGKAFRFHHPELSVAIHRSDTPLPHRFICVLRYMHYKHTQKDLSTIKIKKMQENEKESVDLASVFLKKIKKYRKFITVHG
jgi:hypothetical protein